MSQTSLTSLTRVRGNLRLAMRVWPFRGIVVHWQGNVLAYAQCMPTPEAPA